MAKFLLLVILLFAGAYSLPSAVLTDTGPGKFWTSCGGSHVKITNVTVAGCSSAPCKVEKGDNLTVTVEFTPDKDFKDLDNKVCASTRVACVNLPMPSESACDDGVKCPIRSGKRYREVVTVPIRKGYPSLAVWATWRLEDPYDELRLEGCFLLSIKIQD